jgi:hypothetical protein
MNNHESKLTADRVLVNEDQTVVGNQRDNIIAIETEVIVPVIVVEIDDALGSCDGFKLPIVDVCLKYVQSDSRAFLSDASGFPDTATVPSS